MCGDYNLRREKRYVEVNVRFTPDGKIRPLAINYDKTRTYGIDRVLAVNHGTSRFGVKGHCLKHGSMMALLNAILLFDILNISREICYSLAGMRNPG